MKLTKFTPLVVAVLVGAVFVAPLFAVLEALRFEALRDLFGRASFWKSVYVTLWSAAAGAVLSVAMGFWWARLFVLFEFPHKGLLRLLALIPYFVPNFVLATATVLCWNPASGLMNSFINFPGGLYGGWGLAWMFGVSHAPVAYIILEEKLRRMDASLREAAQMAGASAFLILRRIELPLLLPALISAIALSFGLSLAAFAIPAWIGAPAKVYTFSYRIYQAIQLSGQEGFGEASAYAVILALISLPFVLLVSWVARNEKKYSVVTGKSVRLNLKKLSTVESVFHFGLFGGFQLVVWVIPFGALLASTLVPPGCLQMEGARCLAQMTTASYRYVLFELGETAQAFSGSLTYGVLAAIVALMLSMALVVFCSKSKSALRVIDSSLNLASALPGALIAIGLIMVLSGRWGINLYNTPWIVVVAYVLKHTNLAFQPLRTGYLNLSGALTEAGRLAGAKSTETWGRIVFPLLRPELAGGFLLCLIPILGELTMSIFLVSPSFRSIGTLIFELQDYADQIAAAALSVLLLCVTLVLHALARILNKQGAKV